MSALVNEGAQPYDILILSNGPGELTTWVRPVVLELRQRIPQARLSLMLSPCPHSSGQEHRIIETYLDVDRVQDVDYFWAFLLTGQTEEAWDWAPRGVVIFLGGDQFYALIAGQRLGYRVVVYAEHQPRWRIWIDAFAVRTEAIKKQYGRHLLFGHRWQRKMVVVGDLMVDGVASATYLPGLPIPGWATSGTTSTPTMPQNQANGPLLGNSSPQGMMEESTIPGAIRQGMTDVLLLPRGWRRLTEKGRTHFQVGILPGSKPAKLSLGVPLGLAIADELRQLIPQTTFVVPVAPTLSARQLASYALPKTNPDIALVTGTSAVLEQTNLGAQFVTPYGTVVHLWTSFPAYSVLANCDLCITTIGANTAELARLGVPMLVLIPLNKLDAMRAWDGLPGLLTRLPLVGSRFARWINWFASRWLGLLAWPNIWAGEEVVPELRGELKPVDVAQKAAELLKNAQTREQMREQLRALGGSSGAAQAIVELVSSQLAKTTPRVRRRRSN